MRKVAIVMATKDNLVYLEKAVEAILKTKYPCTLIIVDGGSTDGTKEYLSYLSKKYNHITPYFIQSKGSIEAVNYGIQQTTDEDIYLTQDDVIIPTLQFEWLEQFTYYLETYKPNALTTIGCGGISGKDFLENFMWVGTWSLYLPRETINKIGLFDTSLNPGDDIDYTYRMIKEGMKILTVPFWVEHHQLRTTPHQPKDSETIKKMGELFKRKHDLK